MAPARYEVLLTQGAEEDLEAIHTYLTEHRSPAEAADFLQALLERIATLEHLPLRGAIPNELQALGIDEFRQVLLGPYRVLYRIHPRQVMVYALLDGRRDMQTLLEQRLLRR